ncbi:MAG: ATP-binding cassette domain-containing protein [Alphaproteobacteria bacterium]
MDYLLHILVMVALYAILAGSFNLLIGFSGLFAFSHAAFFGVGAYTTAILTTQYGIMFPWPLLIGVAITALVGLAIGLPALRVGAEYLVIITLALQIIAVAVMLNWTSLTGGTQGIGNIPRIHFGEAALDTAAEFLPVAIAGAAISIWAAWRLGASPFGRALRAMRENEAAAQAIGKNVVAMKLIVFAVSAGIASIAGALYAHYIAFVSAVSFTIETTIYVLAMVILGGTGNLAGSVLGAAILVILPELLKFVDLPPDIADKLRQVMYGLILILMLRLRPQGLLPEHEEGRIRIPAGLGMGGLGDLAPAVAADGVATVEGRGLMKSFGGIVAVREFDIDLKRGRIIGLIGPNGAGKTTAFNLITGFLRPNAGTVRFRDATVSGLPPHRIVRAGMARSFQDLKLFRKMTVLDNVTVALPRQSGDGLVHVYFLPWVVRREERENLDRAMAVLRFVGLHEKAGELAENLSYAEEKLLVIARLLATGAEVLLFDEPLSGLDPSTMEGIFPIVRRLAEQGKTICIIEHNLDVIRGLCDWAVFLDEGRKIAEGTPETLIADPVLAERYFK